jgi:superfamily II DNA/RNA helicase
MNAAAAAASIGRGNTGSDTRLASLSSLSSVKFLVLDEVDRLLNARGKYASSDQIKQHKATPAPCAILLDKITDGRSSDSLQIVAASATVGR